MTYLYPPDSNVRQMRLQRRIRGFTLIEAIASIVVLGVLGIVASNLLATASGSYQNAAVRSELHKEASMTVDRITRILRSIPPDTSSDDPAPSINEFASDAIFWLTPDGAASIEWTGSDIMITSAGEGAVLLQNDVSQFSLRAFDESNVALPGLMSGPACHAIRRIEVTLEVERHGVDDMLRSRVFIRAMADGGAGE